MTISEQSKEQLINEASELLNKANELLLIACHKNEKSVFYIEKLQGLINLLFEMVPKAYDWGWMRRSTINQREKDEREVLIEWVRAQIAAQGIKTVPMGSSWGVIKDVK